MEVEVSVKCALKVLLLFQVLQAVKCVFLGLSPTNKGCNAQSVNKICTISLPDKSASNARKIPRLNKVKDDCKFLLLLLNYV